MRVAKRFHARCRLILDEELWLQDGQEKLEEFRKKECCALLGLMRGVPLM